jgi:hypothetical protein
MTLHPSRSPKKRTVLWLLAASLSVGGVARAQSLIANSVSGAPGQSVHVKLTTDASVVNLASLQCDLNFSRSVPAEAPALEVATMQDGTVDDLTSDLSGSPTGALKPGELLTLGAYSTIDQSGAVVAFDLLLTIPSSAPVGATYDLELSNIIAADAQVRPFSLSATSGVVTVVSPTIVYGDANGDGSVTTADVVLLLQYYLGLATPSSDRLRASDVRPKPGANGADFGDGKISGDDLNAVLRASIGLISLP